MYGSMHNFRHKLRDVRLCSQALWISVLPSSEIRLQLRRVYIYARGCDSQSELHFACLRVGSQPKLGFACLRADVPAVTVVPTHKIIRQQSQRPKKNMGPVRLIATLVDTITGPATRLYRDMEFRATLLFMVTAAIATGIYARGYDSQSELYFACRRVDVNCIHNPNSILLAFVQMFQMLQRFCRLVAFVCSHSPILWREMWMVWMWTSVVVQP